VGVEHDPTALLVAVLCNFRSIDMRHCRNILKNGNI
jgi:hypothetical protein